MAVVSLNVDSLSHVGSSSTSPCHVMQESGCSSIAMACKEALEEWVRSTTRFPIRPSLRFCMARTVFLLSGLAKAKPATATKPVLEQDLVSHIQHVAFVITQEVHLKDVLTALSSLPYLKTVFILLPEYCCGHFQSVTTDNARQHVTSNLDALAGCLSAEIGSYSSRPLGLFVVQWHKPMCALVIR